MSLVSSKLRNVAGFHAVQFVRSLTRDCACIADIGPVLRGEIPFVTHRLGDTLLLFRKRIFISMISENEMFPRMLTRGACKPSVTPIEFIRDGLPN